MAPEHTPIIISAAFMVCVICQWLAWKVKLPAILFLLLVGLVSGPLLNLVNPESLLGPLFFPFISLSVAIILFEGSITLKFREIAGLESVVRNMLSVGLVITWLITTAAARLIIGVSWEIAFLFGALTVVTGPTVIAPLLRTVRPTAATAQILRWEGIVIDPIGASLAVLVYEFIISESMQQAWWQTLWSFLQIVAVGFLIGALAGYLFGLILRNRLLPEFLQNISTLALIFVSFVLANFIQPESGLVTVTVLGMWLANMPGVDLDEILRFKESLSILLISLLFLILTARLDVKALEGIGLAALAVFFIVQLVARPVNVMLSALGSRLSFKERLFLAWIAPRGIVAAAISSLFAIKLEVFGFADAELLVPLTFTIIIGTVLLQSLTALPLARYLGVTEAEPHGFLIIGANPVAREIGLALARHNVRVLLTDTDWGKVQEARRAGLEVYYGSPLSEYADRHMSLAGIGRMLGLSPYESDNIAAALRFRLELGKNNIFILNSARDRHDRSVQSLPKYASLLFDETITYKTLHDILSAGGEITTIRIQQDADAVSGQTEFVAAEGSIPLFLIDAKGALSVFPKKNQKVEPGATLIQLQPAFTKKNK